MVALLIILKILLYILVALLGLLLLLLVVPFSYSGQLLSADGFRLQLSFGWAWRLLGINAEVEGDRIDVSLLLMSKKVYRLKGITSEEKAEESEQSSANEAEDEKEKKGLSLTELANRELINEVFSYIKRVLDIAKPKYLHIYGTYGFEDPSITGIVCGMTGIIKAMVPKARLHLTPDFTQELLDLDVRVEGSMTAGSLAYQTVRTALKKPVRKILFKKKKG